MNTDVIIFFLTFNPITIGLLINVFYTHISNIRRDLWNIVHIRRGPGNIDPPKRDSLSSDKIRGDLIRQYCFITDIWLFSGLIFWIVGIFVGIVVLGEEMKVDLLISPKKNLIVFSLILNLCLHIGFVMPAVVKLLFKGPVKIKPTKGFNVELVNTSKVLKKIGVNVELIRACRVLRAIRRILRKMEFYVFICIMVLFPILYSIVIIKHTSALCSKQLDLLVIYMVLVSVVYLLIWALLPALYSPLYQLEMMRRPSSPKGGVKGGNSSEDPALSKH